MSDEQAMTGREKAVAIAKDVLEHVQTYHWSRGTYLSGSWYGGTHLTGDLQDHVEEVEKSCTMCLLGACLVSKARLFDAVPLAKLYRSYYDGAYVDHRSINPEREAIEPLLQDIFPSLELSKIESAFERRVMNDGCDDTTANWDLLRGAALFGRRLNDDADRVTAVMENIIANDGIFVVDPVTRDAYDAAVRSRP